MKARVWDRVRLLVDVPGEMSERDVIPVGTLGVVVEAYETPVEGYAVDTAIPIHEEPYGYEYDNVILYPDQFIVVMRYVEDESLAELAAAKG